MWRWWDEEDGVCLDDAETRSLMDRETWAPARVGDEGMDPADIRVADRRPEVQCLLFFFLFVAQLDVFALVGRPMAASNGG